jgi:hypothetical protein
MKLRFPNSLAGDYGSDGADDGFNFRKFRQCFSYANIIVRSRTYAMPVTL